MAGRFITLEGGEGAGKSTQAKRLADALRAEGNSVVVTREPGGTQEAEAIRSLLVQGEVSRWNALEEALMNYAARSHHLEHLIRPALARGDWVICDRFLDSTRAYQGIVGKVPLELIDQLERDIVGQTHPDLTLIFDVPTELGLSRARLRGNGGADRYERKGTTFHRRLRDAFLHIASQHPERCVVVDASCSEDEVFAQIMKVMRERLHV
jgi:dTMP kinase